MTNYLFYKEERLVPEGGGHIATQVKYICECSEPKKTAKIHPLCGMGHEMTRDNFYILAGQVASLVECGDRIDTIEHAGLGVGTKVGDEFFPEVCLRLPLNRDELRILSEQVLEAIRGK